MNADSGLFHLLMAVRTVRNGNSFAQAQESSSTVEPKLPDIDHSLISWTPLHLGRTANRCCEIAAADSDHETTKERIFISERQRPKFLRRFLENAGWIVPGTILALLPKCPACVATYALIGTGVGFSLSGATYLRALLVILCTVSLLYLAVRSMHPVIAALFERRIFTKNQYECAANRTRIHAAVSRHALGQESVTRRNSKCHEPMDRLVRSIDSRR